MESDWRRTQTELCKWAENHIFDHCSWHVCLILGMLLNLTDKKKTWILFNWMEKQRLTTKKSRNISCFTFSSIDSTIRDVIIFVYIIIVRKCVCKQSDLMTPTGCLATQALQQLRKVRKVSFFLALLLFFASSQVCFRLKLNSSSVPPPARYQSAGSHPHTAAAAPRHVCSWNASRK